MILKYNDNDIKSILDYSSLLIGKTFLDVINEAMLDEDIKKQIIDKYSRPNFKGGLGILLEELYFGYKANSNQVPDFSKVGMELKSSPYEFKNDGTLRAGERLSITMVPHDRPIESVFYNSDVWHKIEKLLLIYYLRDRTLESRLNCHIDYSYLFTPPVEDLKIIIDDFNIIVNKVLSGKAHEISESDTLYFGYLFGASGYYSNESCVPSTLKTVTITTTTNIPDNAFYNCKTLETINLPNTLETIGEYAFYNCSHIDIIVIPINVTTIEKYAFTNCNYLERVTFKYPYDWYVTRTYGSTFGTNLGILSDTYTNSDNLTYNYDDYYWYRSN